jgi:hypothetical protein
MEEIRKKGSVCLELEILRSEFKKSKYIKWNISEPVIAKLGCQDKFSIRGHNHISCFIIELPKETRTEQILEVGRNLPLFLVPDSGALEVSALPLLLPAHQQSR